MKSYCKDCGSWAVPKPDSFLIENKGIKIADAVEAVISARSGSSDPMNPVDEVMVVSAILWKLNNWKVKFGKSLKYDEAVRRVVIDGLMMWFETAKHDLLCLGCAKALYE